MSYCDYCNGLPKNDIHRIYHDEVYGQKCRDDQELFGRLIFEINQAGLSWSTILKNQKAFGGYATLIFSKLQTLTRQKSTPS